MTSANRIRHYAAPENWCVWIAATLIPLAMILVTDGHMDRLPQFNSAWLVDRAQVTTSDSIDADQLTETGWVDVTLPHRSTDPAGAAHNIWYRLAVNVDEPPRELWAVYISRPIADYAIYVNGQFIGASDLHYGQVQMSLEPLFFKFPGALLRSGYNDISIRTQLADPRAGLPTVCIGPQRILGATYDIDYLWEVTLKQITVVCMLAMAMMMAALFKLRARDGAFGCFALALVFWSAHIEIKLTSQPALLTPELWSSLNAIAAGGYVISAAYFVHRFAGVVQARLEQLFRWWVLLGCAVLIVGPLSLHHQLPYFCQYLWFPSILLIGGYQSWVLMRAAQRTSNLETQLFAVISWWILIVAIRDSLMGAGFLKLRPQYLTFGVGPVLLVAGFVLLRRFLTAVEVVTHARHELELRVEEKSKELQANLTRIKDMEREQALRTERERIMRDMHDGVGGQLVQALSMAVCRPELSAIEKPLRNCLEELRLIIDSIESVEGDLASILGMLRMRMSRRFTNAGIPLHWNVEEIPLDADFEPSRVLRMLRIVREAIVNALEHSCAKRIILSARIEDEHDLRVVMIEVADDGEGFCATATPGRGIANMKRHAQELNARFAIESNKKGTIVRIRLPILVQER